jgi:ribosomal-protein-alanine N-acetyltransferase
MTAEQTKSHIRLETARLVLRAPQRKDADAIFAFASDAEVTRYLGWPRHTSLDETRAFLDVAAAEWSQWPAGPLLIESRADGRVLGSTGLSYETPYRAGTGYVLARRHWGRGFASEALGAVVGLAARLSVQRLYALCHVAHPASARVLERCGFELEGVLRRYLVFPNLDDQTAQDVRCYARALEDRG